MVHFPDIGFVPGDDERPENIRPVFWFCPHFTEFKSETKARAIANDAGNLDSARCLELDLHQFARLQIDPTVEFHAGAA
jgi:hypothetical protein